MSDPRSESKHRLNWIGGWRLNQFMGRWVRSARVRCTCGRPGCVMHDLTLGPFVADPSASRDGSDV